MTQQPSPVGLIIEGGVATITIDRPPLNAVDLGLIDDMLAAIARVHSSDARALVVTGRGRAFVAGADLAMLADLSEENHRRARGWVSVQDALEALPVPVLAAINGFALGGGCELALACDLRWMADSAKIGLPELRFGLFPGAGGTQRLMRLVGPSRAFRLILDGRHLTAEEAERAGVVDRVLPAADLAASAREWAAEMATRPTAAIGLLKRVIRAGYGRPIDEGLRIEEDAVMEVIRTNDAAEGIAAFFEKRHPTFSGD